MDSIREAPPQLRLPFDLLELLSSLPDVFINNLLPALEARHAAALALTCSILRDAVQQHNARQQLSFQPGNCCLVRGHQLGGRFPNVRHLLLKPGNLHEAMNVVPLVLMAARQMTGLTSIVLQDMLADRPNEEAQCGSCAAFTSTYDLSAILATAAHCAPHLRALEFTTHYISDAECAALALMTGLTRLRLRSTHGTHVGGLAHLSALTALASLSLSDWNHSSRASDQDLCMLLGSSSMTSLSLGSSSLTAPLLNCLAAMHAPDWLAGLARQPAAHQADVAGVRATLAQRSIADTAAELLDADTEQQLPAPPPLLCLHVLLNSLPHPNECAFRSACCLTGLTCLQLGWVTGRRGEAGAYGPSWPVSTQQQLSSLTSLHELALGWYVRPEVLAALGQCSRLTCLQLGGLFSMLPDPPPVGQLRLPSVRRLTAQLERPESFIPDRTELRSYADALAVFPGLTRLELAGRLFGDTMTHMLELVPRQLQVLLLPQRMFVSGLELVQLKQLRGLTHLRLGWRSVYHAGPAWYVPDGLEQQRRLAPSLKHLIINDWAPRAAAAGRDPRTYHARSGPGYAQLIAGSTGSAAACSTGGEAAAAAAPPPVDCEACGASPSTGCFCRLSHVEVCGPLPLRELVHLRFLPSLRRLTLRDNTSWSSGLPLTELAALTSQLTLLELFRCQGVDGSLLERPGAAAAAGAGSAVDPSSCYEGCRVVVDPRGGATAAELGRGHQHMGMLLEQWEEAGAMPDERPGAAVYTSEVLLQEPPPMFQLDPPPQQQQQQQQQPPAHQGAWPGLLGPPQGMAGPPGLRPPFGMPPLQHMRPPPGFPRPGLPPPAMLQQMQQMLQHQVQQAQHLQQAAAQLHQQVHQHVVAAGGGGGGGPRPQVVNLPGGGVFMWQGGPGAAAVHHVPGGVVVHVGGLAQGGGGGGAGQQQVDVIDLAGDDDEGGGGAVEALEVQDSDDSDAIDGL